MNPQLLDFFGLVFALTGVLILACGFILSRKRALKIGVSRIAEESDDKNICLPHVRDEIRESKCALIGAVLLTIGFLLQIIAALLSL